MLEIIVSVYALSFLVLEIIVWSRNKKSFIDGLLNDEYYLPLGIVLIMPFLVVLNLVVKLLDIDIKDLVLILCVVWAINSIILLFTGEDSYYAFIVSSIFFVCHILIDEIRKVSEKLECDSVHIKVM